VMERLMRRFGEMIEDGFDFILPGSNNEVI
jgi:hypothetical protein